MIAAVLLAFGSAIAGAVIGAYLQRRWTPNPSTEIVALRQRIAALEEERNRRDELAHFRPDVEVTGEPPDPQHLILTSDRVFLLRGIEYLSDSGAMIASENFNLRGKRIEAKIDSAKITQIFNLVPRVAFVPIPISFRCRLNIDDIEREHTVEVLIKPKFKQINGATTACFPIVRGL